MKALRTLSLTALAIAALLPLSIPTTWARSKPVQGGVIAQRQKIMKNNGANVKQLLKEEKAGNIEEIAVNARRIEANLTKVGSLFPAGSTSDKSRAKPEIWKEKDKFQRDRKAAIAAAAQLQKFAAAGDAAAVHSQIKKLGDACSACHKSFRKPKNDN